MPHEGLGAMGTHMVSDPLPGGGGEKFRNIQIRNYEFLINSSKSYEFQLSKF